MAVQLPQRTIHQVCHQIVAAVLHLIAVEQQQLKTWLFLLRVTIAGKEHYLVLICTMLNRLNWTCWAVIIHTIRLHFVAAKLQSLFLILVRQCCCYRVSDRWLDFSARLWWSMALMLVPSLWSRRNNVVCGSPIAEDIARSDLRWFKGSCFTLSSAAE